MKRLLAGCALALACAGQAGAATVIYTPDTFRFDGYFTSGRLKVSGVMWSTGEHVSFTRPLAGFRFSIRPTPGQPSSATMETNAPWKVPDGSLLNIHTGTLRFSETIVGSAYTATAVVDHSNRNQYASFTLRGVVVNGKLTGKLGVVDYWEGQASAGSGIMYSYLGTVAVPEPSTWAIMIGGFGLVGGVLRRRHATVTLGP